MGLRDNFIRYVQTLFGNSRTRVAVNGQLTPTFDIHRSIRQGCPLAPLLYAIASDGLSCLVANRMETGVLQGIKLPNNQHLCMQLFADDTSALIKQDERSLHAFWECLEIYCLASGSAINHSKTGIKSSKNITPQWLLDHGCEIIPEGAVFRLLGIPMGFGISLQQRWSWALDRIKSKLERWRNNLLSMAGRILVINKYIIPTIIYFLACWRPPEKALKQFNSLCRNFLWSGSTTDYRIPKVKWDICTHQKDKGGLGILNSEEMANRLASKWIVRSLFQPEEDWAVLLHRNLDKAKLADLPLWKDIPQLTLLFSSWPVSPKGSPFIKSIWRAWNQIKGMVIIRPNKASIPYLSQDSIWWPLCRPQVPPQDVERARILHNKGLRTWADLWDFHNHQWKDDNNLRAQLELSDEELLLLRDRKQIIEPQDEWKIGVRDRLNPKGVGWTEGTLLFPIPKMELSQPIHVKLNQRWDTLLDRRQWYFKFFKLWAATISPKMSVHLWLILHQALWTGSRALKAKVGDGRCPRCRRSEEDIFHLFMDCPHNTLVLGMLNRILRTWKNKEVSWKQLLLGDSIGCSTGLWNTIRACFLWHMWIQRNAKVFGSAPPHINELVFSLSFQVRKHLLRTKELLQERMDFLQLGKNHMHMDVLWNSNRHIIYSTWYEELAKEMAEMETRDQTLAELVVETATFYKEIDDQAPPRSYP